MNSVVTDDIPGARTRICMAGGGLDDIAGTRVRFQRLSDAHNFNGWILRLKGDGVVVTTGSEVELEVGDRFRFEAFGLRRSVEFQAVLLKAGNPVAGGPDDSLQRYLALRVVGKPAELDAKEVVRLHVEGMSACVTAGPTRELVEVVDIAPRGMGIHCRTIIEPGAEVELEIGTVYGSVHAKGKVCYCRRSREARGLGRIGISLTQLNRVDAARWEALFDVTRVP